MSIVDFQHIIVEDGYNASYITNLFISLFYNQTNINQILLDTEPCNINFIYFQEMVKHNFIDKIRKKSCIMSGCINELRNFIFINGFSNNIDITNELHILYFYKYLLNNTNNQSMLINSTNATHIELNLSELHQEHDHNHDTYVSIKSLLKEWSKKNTIYVKNDFHTTHIPQIVPIYINRNNKKLKIDINEKIKLDPKMNVRWIINAVVCIRDNKYYTLFREDKESNPLNISIDKIPNKTYSWFIFDNSSIPSIKEVNMNDKLLADIIRDECVFLIYRYFY